MVCQNGRRGRQGRGEMDPKIAVLVGGDGFFRSIEPGCDDGIGDRAAGNAPADIAKLVRRSPRLVSGVGLRLPEHPTNQEDLGAGTVAAVGLDDHAALALRLLHRPGSDAQHPDQCAQPFLTAPVRLIAFTLYPCLVSQWVGSWKRSLEYCSVEP